MINAVASAPGNIYTWKWWGHGDRIAGCVYLINSNVRISRTTSVMPLPFIVLEMEMLSLHWWHFGANMVCGLEPFDSNCAIPNTVLTTFPNWHGSHLIFRSTLSKHGHGRRSFSRTFKFQRNKSSYSNCPGRIVEWRWMEIETLDKRRTNDARKSKRAGHSIKAETSTPFSVHCSGISKFASYVDISQLNR